MTNFAEKDDHPSRVSIACSIGIHLCFAQDEVGITTVLYFANMWYVLSSNCFSSPLIAAETLLTIVECANCACKQEPQ